MLRSKCVKCKSTDVKIKENIISLFYHSDYQYKFKVNSYDGSLEINNAIRSGVDYIFDDYMRGVLSPEDIGIIYEPDLYSDKRETLVYYFCNDCKCIFSSPVSISTFFMIYDTFLSHENEELIRILKDDIDSTVEELIQAVNIIEAFDLENRTIRRELIIALWKTDKKKYHRLKRINDAMQNMPPNCGGGDNPLDYIIYTVCLNVFSNYISFLLGSSFHMIKYKYSVFNLKRLIKKEIKKNKKGIINFDKLLEEKLSELEIADTKVLSNSQKIQIIEDYALKMALEVRANLIKKLQINEKDS